MAASSEEKPIQRAMLGLLALFMTIVIGTIGYSLIEHWRVLDALYMTIITITTTGFGEVHPLSDAGRVFTLTLIVLGIASIGYTTGRVLQIIVQTHLFRRRRMNKHIDELTDHFIVCGYGKIGKYVCEELMARKAPFVVLEKDPAAIDSLTPLNYLYLQGDATDDDVLGNAGIGRAKGLVAALQDDADNVFATLSAKVLNPAIYIVAMAVEEESETKLLRAGASRVVKPYEAGGTRMAELLLRPGVIEFIDIVARDRQIDLNIEEISIKEGSPLSGETLAGSEIRQKLNVIIVSVHKPDGKFMFNPLFSTQLVAGDRLIAIGEESSLTQLQKLASGT